MQNQPGAAHAAMRRDLGSFLRDKNAAFINAGLTEVQLCGGRLLQT